MANTVFYITTALSIARTVQAGFINRFNIENEKRIGATGPCNNGKSKKQSAEISITPKE